MLVGHALTKSFGSTRVLHGVDIEVPPGQVTVLLGPNGCGKSTLLRALSILDPPDGGTVRIGDRSYAFPANGKPQAVPWPLVTVVFQQLFLWPHLTVRENIALPLRKISGDIDESVALFDLAELLDRYPNEISLGQRQRVALARAIGLRPRFLLLDEVTSALDVDYVRRVGEQLRAFADSGVGVMIITHFLGFARRIADRVVFMSHGRIVESGSPTVLERPQSEEFQRFLSIVE